MEITLETQIANEINILDLSINIFNNKCNFDIYRKLTYKHNLTQTNNYIIPNDSNQPSTQNVPYSNSVLYILVRISLNKVNYEEQI